MHGRTNIGQSRDKKTIACDSSCLAQVDAAAHKANYRVAIGRAQLLEDNPTGIEVVVARCWGRCGSVAGCISETGQKTAWLKVWLETTPGNFNQKIHDD